MKEQEGARRILEGNDEGKGRKEKRKREDRSTFIQPASHVARNAESEERGSRKKAKLNRSIHSQKESKAEDLFFSRLIFLSSDMLSTSCLLVFFSSEDFLGSYCFLWVVYLWM